MASKKKGATPSSPARRAKGAALKRASPNASKAAKRSTATTGGRLESGVPSASKAAKGSAATTKQNGWAEKYIQVFGAPFPKGKVLNAAGEYITLRAAAREALCVMQCEPRPNRMGWVYVSQGLFQRDCQIPLPRRIEVILHWKERDPKLPVRVLSKFAQYMRQAGKFPASGEIVSDGETIKLGDCGFRHWLVCPPEKNVPEFSDARGNKTSFVVLLGISDTEMQCALKVNAALADGRQVLLHALKTGGVFPLSDPARPCLTRRRDFQRLWENSFRLVRDQRV